MKSTMRKRRLCVIAGLLLVAGCGIDQGGSPAPEEVPQTASITYGPIDGFGSIILNGQTIGTAGATIFINEIAAGEADLRVGQIARVESVITNSTNSAVRVDYRPSLAGPVSEIDQQAAELTVLGQTVVVDDATVFDLPGVVSVADIAASTVIEVSALSRPGGTLLARYVGVPPDPATFSIATTISSVDPGQLVFALGNLNVDYSQVNVLEVPGGIPTVGLTVRVVGTTLGNAGELIADRVLQIGTDPGVFSLLDTDLSTSAAAGSIAGDVDAFTANFVGFIETSNAESLLTINNLIVGLDEATTIVGGDTADLIAGTLVRVEGEITSPGNVAASLITIL